MAALRSLALLAAALELAALAPLARGVSVHLAAQPQFNASVQNNWLFRKAATGHGHKSQDAADQRKRREAARGADDKSTQGSASGKTRFMAFECDTLEKLAAARAKAWQETKNKTAFAQKLMKTQCDASSKFKTSQQGLSEAFHPEMSCFLEHVVGSAHEPGHFDQIQESTIFHEAMKIRRDRHVSDEDVRQFAALISKWGAKPQESRTAGRRYLFQTSETMTERMLRVAGEEEGATPVDFHIISAGDFVWLSDAERDSRGGVRLYFSTAGDWHQRTTLVDAILQMADSMSIEKVEFVGPSIEMHGDVVITLSRQEGEPAPVQTTGLWSESSVPSTTYSLGRALLKVVPLREPPALSYHVFESGHEGPAFGVAEDLWELCLLITKSLESKYYRLEQEREERDRLPGLPSNASGMYVAPEPGAAFLGAIKGNLADPCTPPWNAQLTEYTTILDGDLL